ncbi:hypothetical protein SLS61_001093 [Didymella pomorum]
MAFIGKLFKVLSEESKAAKEIEMASEASKALEETEEAFVKMQKIADKLAYKNGFEAGQKELMNEIEEATKGLPKGPAVKPPMNF